MTKNFAKPFIVAAALLLAAVAGPANAQATDKSGYLTDTRGAVVKNNYNQCWRTGYWTPALAIAECDPDLVKTAAPAPAPAPAAEPAPAPAPAPIVVPEQQKVTLNADVLFDFDKSNLRPEGRQELDEVVQKMQGMELEVIIAIGHTDSIGTDEYNQKLSVRRAESVKSYLVGKGIAADRIYTEGKGETQPIATNKTREGRQQNRRVEIEVVGTR
ncbi:MAG TPA: OmpA family protein [Burkholderiales bacterium]|nr:OmpA family protein [Burkholderiales bacterium]